MTTTVTRNTFPTYTTPPPDGPPAGWALTGSAWLPGIRLVRAEFLKLARRRGLMITAAVLTTGAVIACVGVQAWLQHSGLPHPGQLSPGQPHWRGPGGNSLARAGLVAGESGVLVAMLLGAVAGAADVTAGVFRHLVSTGRSRVALFLARIPAGLALSVGFMLAGYAATAGGSVLLAGSRPVPPASFPFGGGWLVVSTGLAFLLSLGLSTGGAAIWRAVRRDA